MDKSELKIVFMGTPEFAVPVLKALIDEDYTIVGVITAPDRKAGRGRKLKISPVKEFALENNLDILQPTNLKDPDFLFELKNLNPNLQIVVAFRMLPQTVWSLPEYGTFNLHASLLPQYRGASPINYVIINGEKETGLTTFFIDEKIDTGRIIDRVKIRINENETAGSLHDRMMGMGAELVLSTINKILKNEAVTIDQTRLQPENVALKSAPKLSKEDCHINLTKNPDEIQNLVRGLCPYPAAFLILESKTGKQDIVKIYEIEVRNYSSNNDVNGTILSDNKTYIDVITESGVIRICELQISGKRRMNTREFLQGFKEIVEYKFI